MMPVRIAVLGAGRIGQVHAAAIASVPGATLIAVADPDMVAAGRLRDAYGAELRGIDAIATAGDVDAVVICTPTDTHADLIERFVAAGKAVFCEKPVDLGLTRMKACLAAVDAARGTLMVGFQRRFDPDFNALKAAMDAGRIGKVGMITLASRDPAPPPVAYIERSGGIFRDMMIHGFDVARWLLGEEVPHVMAAASTLVDPEIGEAGDFDSANVILTTATGKHYVVTNTRRATYGYDQRIEVHGLLGSVSAENTHAARIVIADGDGFHRPPLLDFFMSRYRAAYCSEIAAFVHCIEAGAAMPNTGHDGMMALALAEAALVSVAEGRRVALAELL